LKQIFYEKQQKNTTTETESETPQNDNQSSSSSESESESKSESESESVENDENDENDDPLAASESVWELNKSKSFKRQHDQSKASVRYSLSFVKSKPTDDLVIHSSSSTSSLMKKSSTSTKTHTRGSSTSSSSLSTKTSESGISNNDKVLEHVNVLLNAQSMEMDNETETKSQHHQDKKTTSVKKSDKKKKEKNKSKEPKNKIKKDKIKEKKSNSKLKIQLAASDELLIKQNRLVAEFHQQTQNPQTKVTPLWKLTRQNRYGEGATSPSKPNNFAITSSPNLLNSAREQSSSQTNSSKESLPEGSNFPPLDVIPNSQVSLLNSRITKSFFSFFKYL
jgi:hypothetical protein